MSSAQDPSTWFPLTWRGRAFSSIALLALVGFFVSGSVGCRSARDNQIDLLERELRSQEDYIYELEDYVVEYSEKLRQFRCATTQPVVIRSDNNEPELADDSHGSGSKENSHDTHNGKPVVQPEPETPEEPETSEPKSDILPPGAEELNPEDLEIPDVDLELEEPTSAISPQRRVRQASALFAEEVPENELPSMPDPAEMVAEQDTNEPQFINDPELDEVLFEDDPDELEDRTAERLVITNVFRSEQAEPISSLLTVVEARDQHDEPVDLDGTVSLMVMTTDADAPRRIKRWDFSADETATAWQSSHLGDGLHLELPLEKTQLPDEPLELWVRLVTPEGQKLLHQVPFNPLQLVSVDEASPTPENPSQASTSLAAADGQASPKSTSTHSTEQQSKWRPSKDPLHTLPSSTFSSTRKTANKWRRQSADQVQFQASSSSSTVQPAATTGRNHGKTNTAGWTLQR